MTKSTGKREKQKRREELLWAQMKLVHVGLDLLEKLALARLCGCDRERRAYSDGYLLIWDLYLAVLKELEALD